MARNITGQNTLAYLGDRAPTPPNFVAINRAPTTNDRINYFLGDLWLDTSANQVYQLVNLDNNSATWVIATQFGGSDIDTLTGDAGGAVGPDGANNVDIIGLSTSNVTVTGTPASNKLEIATDTRIDTANTTDATPENIVSAPVATQGVQYIKGVIIAAKDDESAGLFASFEGGARRAAGAATMIGTPVVSVSHDSAGDPDVDVLIDTNNLVVQITGVAAENWAWVARTFT